MLLLKAVESIFYCLSYRPYQNAPKCDVICKNLLSLTFSRNCECFSKNRAADSSEKSQSRSTSARRYAKVLGHSIDKCQLDRVRKFS